MPRSSRKAKREQSRKRMVVYTPPPLPTQGRGGMVFRFQKTGGSVASIDNIPYKAFVNLLFMTYGPTAARPIFDAVKIRKICLWSPAVVSTSAAGFIPPPLQLQIKYSFLDAGTNSSVIDQTRVYTDTPSNTRGATVSFKTQKGTPYRAWFNVDAVNTSGTTPNFMGIYAVQGAVCDVHISYQLGGQTPTAKTGLTVAGATTGVIYTNFLDSAGSGGGAGNGYWVCVSNGGQNSVLAY